MVRLDRVKQPYGPIRSTVEAGTIDLLFQKEREKERIYQPIIHTGDQLLMTDLAIIKHWDSNY